MVLMRTTRRVTLIPPPVEPAQAPTNINMTRTTLQTFGQRLKSADENPVEEMMDDTWKTVWVMASNGVANASLMLKKMIAMAPTMMIR